MTAIPERPVQSAPWPTFWPPYDRIAAAGMGEFYGATIRALGGQREESDNDPFRFAKAQIDAAQDRHTISDGDARRLLAYLSLGSEEGTRSEGMSATQLFDAALDDPTSSTLALSILSIAKYKEATATTEALPHGPEAGDAFLLGIACALGATELVLAMYLAEHVRIT
jgi:hypothetical protein